MAIKRLVYLLDRALNSGFFFNSLYGICVGRGSGGGPGGGLKAFGNVGTGFGVLLVGTAAVG